MSSFDPFDIFDQLDQDRNGTISAGELQAAYREHAEAFGLAAMTDDKAMRYVSNIFAHLGGVAAVTRDHAPELVAAMQAVGKLDDSDNSAHQEQAVRALKTGHKRASYEDELTRIVKRANARSEAAELRVATAEAAATAAEAKAAELKEHHHRLEANVREFAQAADDEAKEVARLKREKARLAISLATTKLLAQKRIATATATSSSKSASFEEMRETIARDQEEIKRLRALVAQNKTTREQPTPVKQREASACDETVLPSSAPRQTGQRDGYAVLADKSDARVDQAMFGACCARRTENDRGDVEGGCMIV